jgi:heterodisulfide reductase subunit A-like polyferredoxin
VKIPTEVAFFTMLCRSGAKALRQSRCFSTTSTRQADFTHAVIGGGAVGLAIARKLQQRDGVSTVLIEKHGMVGSETSSRNSEVRLNAARACFYLGKNEGNRTNI